MDKTQELSHISGRKIRAFTGCDAKSVPSLNRIGVDLSAIYGTGQDSLQATLTAPSIASPIQFGQHFLSGFVAVVTSPLVIDEILGVTTAGRWEDEEIVQGVLETTGAAVPYGDNQNARRSNFNMNFEKRSIVRFEDGMEVFQLEAARAALVNLDSADAKRKGAAQSLALSAESVGFNGYNDGTNRTFGLLNDPGLPAYGTLPPGASTQTQWSTKTFDEIRIDLVNMHTDLATQNRGLYDSRKTPTTLVLSVSSLNAMNATTSLGLSIYEWYTKNYPAGRILQAARFTGANAGSDVAYLFIEGSDDVSSTDDKRTFVQVVPMKFKVVGVKQNIKSYEELYTNATAGVMCKRPLNVVRYTGV